ncbi:LysR substrate-binding domain-containing protein [Paracoccus sp. DMF-8]|uniref:LysR substrate-binding domain-containing protein n=1 Tax=Paracoccus sp. DMF-8 TaxID=3019445 RepID=UPI0023E81CA6|nr:LysR substrate-binding domain-containing protein [Paracoccus sp. DMF-8]MDF3605744.1 LysR substrate-binding domain-containing protein [Paracoccus sp. DMF-8]
MLRDAADQVEMRQSVLTISSLVSLAGNWLAPRLDLFQMQHPELTVRLETTDRSVDFSREDIDVAIRYGRGEWPGLETVWLMDFNFSPMLSPALIERAGVREPADLLRLPRIDPTNRAWSIIG